MKNELKVPTITASSLLPVSFATASDADKALPNIGSKASNYATIQEFLGTDAVRPGFGLSFAHYQKIVNEPETAALIQGLLSQ